jgi:hypothetical protein
MLAIARAMNAKAFAFKEQLPRHDPIEILAGAEASALRASSLCLSCQF